MEPKKKKNNFNYLEKTPLIFVFPIDSHAFVTQRGTGCGGCLMQFAARCDVTAQCTADTTRRLHCFQGATEHTCAAVAIETGN